MRSPIMRQNLKEIFFPLRLALHCWEMRNSEDHSADGVTIEIGPSAVHFAVNRAFDVDQKIKLAIEWPAQLETALCRCS